MLKSMREGSAYFIKGVMLLIVVAFIGTIFVVWGVKSAPGDLARRGVVATVDGTEISQQEYQQALQRQINAYKQLFGDKVDEKMLEALNVKQVVLQGLIRRILILRYAESKGIRVGTEELAEQISRMPVFQGKDGFTKRRYLDILRANRLTPEQFESGLRQDLAMQKVEGLVKDAIQVPPDELRDAFDRVRRQLTVEAVELPTGEKGTTLADAITVAMGKGKSLSDAAKEAGVTAQRYGPFPAATPPKEIPDPLVFRQAVDVLKTGETSPLVKGQKAFYLVRLLAQQDPSAAEFAKDEKTFRAEYVQAKRQAVMADWLQQLRREAKITVDAQIL